MNFKEALSKVLQSEGAELSDDPFRLYSRLSDLCNSYIDKQKISLLFEVDKRLHIVRSVITDGRIAVAALKTAYPAVKSVMSEETYKNLIACVAEAAFPAIKVKSQPTEAKVKKATVLKAEIEEEEELKTLLNGKPNYMLWSVMIAVALLFVAGIVCLCIFGKYLNWNSWQHIIGSVGGLIIIAVLALLAMYSDDALILDFYKSGALMLLLSAVVNCALFFFLRENYKIIFIWLSAYGILCGGLLVFANFYDLETGWAIIQIIETAIILTCLILGLIFL